MSVPTQSTTSAVQRARSSWACGPVAVARGSSVVMLWLVMQGGRGAGRELIGPSADDDLLVHRDRMQGAEELVGPGPAEARRRRAAPVRRRPHDGRPAGEEHVVGLGVAEPPAQDAADREGDLRGGEAVADEVDGAPGPEWRGEAGQVVHRPD